MDRVLLLGGQVQVTLANLLVFSIPFPLIRIYRDHAASLSFFKNYPTPSPPSVLTSFVHTLLALMLRQTKHVAPALGHFSIFPIPIEATISLLRFYQIRSHVKASPKLSTKVEVSLPSIDQRK